MCETTVGSTTAINKQVLSEGGESVGGGDGGAEKRAVSRGR